MKSWGIARALLLLGAQKSLRILCVRELQASLDDSVHKLLSDQIYAMGLQGFYTIEKAAIKGANGTEFAFEGIRHNVQKIKSYEGIDICWVEEAQAVSKFSWNVLVPTIRKPGSEIWVSFNPFREADETYQRFIVHTPKNAFVQALNWRDNPWFSQELRDEMEDLKARDYDSYMNVWEGQCVVNLEGAVYAAELRNARMEGRICDVPYERTMGVTVAFDLGRRDFTAMWFGQKVAMQDRLVDYHEARGKDFSYFVEHLKKCPYIVDLVVLPHDGGAKVLGSKHSIEEQVRAHGFQVKVLKRQPVVVGISATRSIFPSLWFDAKRCEQGLKRLAEYHFDVDPESKEYSVNPVHDEASHGADALRTYAMAKRAAVPQVDGARKLPGLAAKFLSRPLPFMQRGNVGWMAR